MQGGVGAYTHILAEHLAAAGHTVSIATSPPALAQTSPVTVSPCVTGWNSLGTVSALRAWAHAFQPDVINLQYQTAAYAMAGLIHALPAVLGYPFVTTFHDLRPPYLFPKAGPLRRALVMQMAKTSSGAIITNHEDAAALAALAHVRMIPIGSNITAAPPAEARASARAASGTAPGAPLIGYFGLVNHSKGLDVLLRAVRRLIDGGLPVRLMLIGAVAGDSDPSNRAYMAQIDSLIDALALRPHITRTSYLSDDQAAAHLAAADVIALPFADGASFRRGSLLAALHQGRATVTTQPQVPVPEFMRAGALMLVPTGDDAALADGLKRVLTDAPLRASLERGALALSADFAWPNIAAATADFFAQTIATIARQARS